MTPFMELQDMSDDEIIGINQLQLNLKKYKIICYNMLFDKFLQFYFIYSKNIGVNLFSFFFNYVFLSLIYQIINFYVEKKQKIV